MKRRLSTVKRCSSPVLPGQESCIDCCGWMRRARWFLLLGIATCQRFDFFWDHWMVQPSSNPFREVRNAVA